MDIFGSLIKIVHIFVRAVSKCPSYNPCLPCCSSVSNEAAIQEAAILATTRDLLTEDGRAEFRAAVSSSRPGQV